VYTDEIIITRGRKCSFIFFLSEKPFKKREYVRVRPTIVPSETYKLIDDGHNNEAVEKLMTGG
jgi:hypothetical protein